jgi:protein-disulfide isomerase
MSRKGETMSSRNDSREGKAAKSLVIILVLLAAAAAGYGYFNQSAQLREGNGAQAAGETATPPAQTADAAKPAAKLPPASSPLFSPKADDIVIGDARAPVTIVEYASLSCPHCAHFSEEVLPQLKKEYLDTGKAKLAFRHFPLNAPALKAAELVECADKSQRENFLHVLFKMQDKWAFTPLHEKSLKQIAAVGGVDEARFDACLKDKALEARIVATRAEGEKVLLVDATPTFFVNGRKIEGEATLDAFRNVINK